MGVVTKYVKVGLLGVMLATTGLLALGFTNSAQAASRCQWQADDGTDTACYNNTILSAVAETGTGSLNATTSGVKIPAGSKITVSFTYSLVGSHTGGSDPQAKAWVSMDGISTSSVWPSGCGPFYNNQLLEVKRGGSTVATNVGPGNYGSGGDTHVNTACPTPSNPAMYGYTSTGQSPENGGNCPSFYVASTSPFYLSGLENSGPGGPQQGKTYPTNPAAPLFGSVTTCGNQGASVVWNNVDRGAGSHTYSFSFYASPNVSSGNYCFNGHFSVGTLANEQARAKKDPICFTLDTTTINGLVRGDADSTTGKRLRKVQVAMTKALANGDCVADSLDTTETAADGTGTSASNINNDGKYSFPITKGQRYCILPASFKNMQGTRYSSPSPNFIGGLCGNSDPCNGSANFRYQSEGAATITGKSVTKVMRNGVNVGSGNINVKPGDVIYYRITAENPYDYSIPNVQINDYIPNNIQPDASSTLDKPTISSTGMTNVPACPQADTATNCKPGDWTVATSNPGLCQDTSYVASLAQIAYGRLSPPAASDATSGSSVISCQFNQFSTGVVGLNQTKMPAYSQMVYEWHGTVKTAQNIGVYPENDTNCQDTGSRPKNAGVVPGCQNLDTGMQTVFNKAFIFNNSFFATGSPTTSNPIPSAITCVSKSVVTGGSNTVQTDGLDNLVSANGCNDGQTVQSGTNVVYVPGTYDQATFNIRINRDTTGGPLTYALYDQFPYPGVGLSPAIQSVNSTNPTASPWSYGGVLGFADRAIGVSNTSDSNFSTTLGAGGPAVGGTFGNYATACVRQYWVAGHPLDCSKISNTVTLKRVNAIQPFLQATDGNVHAGGGVSDTSGQYSCSVATGNAASNSTAQLRGGTNGGSAKGGLFVTVSGGNAGAFTSKLGGNFQSNYGVICRPNVSAAVTAIETKQGAGGTPTAPSNSMNNIDQAAANGKVVKITGNATLTAPMTVTSRYTVHVTGNLYIGGSGAVQYATGTKTLSQQPALGVVVDGNIFIDKGVTRLDGYYIAGANGSSGGMINTCADASGKTLVDLHGLAATGPYYTATDCNAQLTVNGLLMASTFRFNRTYVNGSQAAENVVLPATLYTAVPPGFTNATSAGQKPAAIYEQAPRY